MSTHGREDDAGHEARAARPGYGIDPSSGRVAHRADQPSHGSLPGSRQGLPRAARLAEAGFQAPAPAGVPEADRSREVPSAHRRAGSPPLGLLASLMAPRKSTGALGVLSGALDRCAREARRA